MKRPSSAISPALTKHRPKKTRLDPAASASAAMDASDDPDNPLEQSLRALTVKALAQCAQADARRLVYRLLVDGAREEKLPRASFLIRKVMSGAR